MYVIVDPIGRIDSGISSYCTYNYKIVQSLGFSVSLFKRHSGEKLESFRLRLAAYVAEIKNRYSQIIVEAPESYAVTSGISPDDAQIHIRFHCSSQLGSLVQGQLVSSKAVQMEQAEIDRAAMLSAPSETAIAASRLLFNIRETYCSYPNPGPDWSAAKSSCETKSNYVLFVGRDHRLKGLPWLLEIAAALPSIPFAIVGPTTENLNVGHLPKNITLLDGNHWDRQKTYEKARLVVIPSIFETASMVGIEAIAAGIPVVAWSHLGIAEYGMEPIVTGVSPWSLPEFCKSIQTQFENSDLNTDANATRGSINRYCRDGMTALLQGKNGNHMPQKFSESIITTHKSLFNNLPSISMIHKNAEIPRWRRRLRKLRRDPKLYFQDSKFFRAFGLDKGTPLIRKEVKSVPPTDGNKERLFSHVGTTGRIKFGQPPTKPAGVITALFYPAIQQDGLDKLLESLAAFDDFRYVRSPLLQVATFENLADEHAVDFIERIDRENKKLVSGIDHIIMLNPPPVMVEGLRSVGTRQRTIVILDDPVKPAPQAMHTDVLIVVGEEIRPVEQGWRRIIAIEDRDHLPLAIRRAIQEGVPKNPDMLLPILGFDGNFRSELMEVDVRFHQGIIQVKPEFRPSGGCTMAEICGELAREMIGLAITESTYLRYRNLCDRAFDIVAREQFLTLSLFDGLLYDVRP